MALDWLPEKAPEFSINNILEINPSDIAAVFYLIISIAIYSIIIWHFYRFVAKRDIFKLSFSKYSKVFSFLKYFFLFPLVAFLFFAGFSLMLFFLGKNLSEPQVLSTAFAMIAAIRITAYYNEDLSKDVAKMLPFAMLGLFLIDPSYFAFGDVISKIQAIPNFLILAVQFLLFIIVMEWFLRILLTIKYAIFPKKQQRLTEE
jgi:hypothetical protein